MTIVHHLHRYWTLQIRRDSVADLRSRSLLGQSIGRQLARIPATFRWDLLFRRGIHR